jgi:hypothetical protein
MAAMGILGVVGLGDHAEANSSFVGFVHPPCPVVEASFLHVTCLSWHHELSPEAVSGLSTELGSQPQPTNGLLLRTAIYVSFLLISAILVFIDTCIGDSGGPDHKVSRRNGDRLHEQHHIPC